VNKYVGFATLAIGSILSIYLLSLEKISLFGLECRIVGQRTVQGAFAAMNDPICLNNGVYFTGLSVAGLLVLFGLFFVLKDNFVGSELDPSSAQVGPAQLSKGGNSSSTRSQNPTVSVSYDRQKWSVLKEIDPEIAAAASQVAIHGKRYEEDLAERYMTLGDKTYLNSIVEHVLQRQREEDVRQAAEETRFAAFKETETYKNQLQNLKSANVFETSGGIAVMLPDFRCVQVENTGDITVYADLSDRENYHSKDKKWDMVDTQKKQAHIDRAGEAILKAIFLNGSAQA
jgi:hypothetical protein